MWIILAIILMGAACTSQQIYVNDGAIMSRARKVAVLPLVNLTSYPNAGQIVGNLMNTELMAMTNFNVIEQTKMLAVIRGEKGLLDEKIDRAVATKIGKKLGVDTIIYGSVNEFRYKRGLDENPAAGVTISMLDLQNNKIIWSGSRAATGGCFWFCEDSLSLLAQNICHHLVSNMVKGH